MQWHKGTPDGTWDTSLFAGGGNFLQSSHWAAFNEALGQTVWYGRGKGWQCLAIVENSRTGRRLYCPYGPLATTEVGFIESLQALHQLAKQQKALFVRLEPQVKGLSPAEYGLKHALKDIQPAQTWLLDITRPKEALLADFTPTNRNLYNTASNKGLSFRASQNPADTKIYLKMVHDVAKNTGITPHEDSYYTTMAKVLLPRKAANLYIAEHNGKPVGAAITFDSPTTRYYAHAGNLLSARKLHAGSPLLATMIFDAKEQGQRTFDFVGVAPLGAPKNHRWQGFTQFKKSFGGEYHAFLGTWELPAHPLYRLYRGVYQAHHKLRLK